MIDKYLQLYMAAKLKYEDVKKEFEQRDYTLVSEEYLGVNKKLEFICNKHKDFGVQQVDLNKLRMGYGCKVCKPNYSNRKPPVFNRTTESFQKEIDEIFHSNIKIVSKYRTAKEKVQAKCVKHDYIWDVRPYNLLSGYGYPICGNESASEKSAEDRSKLISRIQEKNPNIIVLSKPEELLGYDSKATCQCKICGHVWSTTHTNLTKRKPTGCPLCKQKEITDSQRSTDEYFQNKVRENNPTIIPIEKYKGNNKEKVKCTCTIHPNIFWYQSPVTLYKGNVGCPKCQVHRNEDKMITTLESFGFTIERQKKFDDCKDIFRLPFDGYNPQNNILFEYDGEQHYMIIPQSRTETKEDQENRLKRTQYHDQIKNEYCKNNNIPLIRVPYWERNNMEEFLKNKLKEIDIQIYQS